MIKLGNVSFKQIIDAINNGGNSVQVITDPQLVTSDDSRYTKMYKFDVTNATRTSILAVYKKENTKYISIPFDFTIEDNTIRVLLNTDSISKILYTDKLLDNQLQNIDLSNYVLNSELTTNYKKSVIIPIGQTLPIQTDTNTIYFIEI